MILLRRPRGQSMGLKLSRLISSPPFPCSGAPFLLPTSSLTSPPSPTTLPTTLSLHHRLQTKPLNKRRNKKKGIFSFILQKEKKKKWPAFRTRGSTICLSWRKRLVSLSPTRPKLPYANLSPFPSSPSTPFSTTWKSRPRCPRRMPFWV